MIKLSPSLVISTSFTSKRKAFGRRTAWEFPVLNNFIALTQVIQIDKNVAKHYGEIKADLSKKGQIISDNDLWIAAHVRSLDATLVSNNLKEFERVQGLKTENWVE